MLVAGIAVAGALGAPVRYVLDGFVQDRADGVFPRGTFVVNVTGSFLLGLLTGLLLYHAFPSDPKIVLGTGFCGAYTTFSTFTYETVRLAEERAFVAAFQNALGSIVVPALAAAAGLALAALG
jgi:CrcB protein